jgi:hypothetical protein
MIRKEQMLGDQLLQFLISHWPMTLDHKAELFISEMVKLLDENVMVCFERHVERVMSCIAIAAESPCTTLADRAYAFVMHENARELIGFRQHPVMRILFPPFYRVARNHWNQRIQLRAMCAMNLLLEINPEVCAAVAAEFRADSLAEAEKKLAHKAQWEAVADTAAKKVPLVDREEVGKTFAQFFDAVRVPARGVNQIGNPDQEVK